MAHLELSDDLAMSPPKTSPWAWGICWLMFASTALNYADRQSMTLVSSQIKAEFGLNDVGFGWVLSSFMMTYAVCQLPAGFLADRWNLRLTYAGAVAWWSLAGMAAAFAPSLAVLMILRAVLGVGESFNWPCALRVTAQILPPSHRGLGNGIFNSGAAVGAILTPLIVTPLAAKFGWRIAFIVTGSLGFVWVGIWLRVLRGQPARLLERVMPPMNSEPPTSDHTGLSRSATLAFGSVALASLLIALSSFQFGLPYVWCGIAFLMFGALLTALLLPDAALQGASWAESLGAIVRLRRFWVLVVVSISINVCWHFLVSWLPDYLKNDRKMTFLASGLWSSVPFLAADLGNLGCGALSFLLARRGFSPARARMVVMTGCTLLISSGAWVGLAPNNTAVIVLLALMALGAAGFMANYFAFTQEVSARDTGLIVGILGGLGNLCAAGFLPLAGKIKVEMGSFGLVFVIVGLLPFLGLGMLALAWGDKARADESKTA